MVTRNRSTVVGVFSDRQQADRAVSELRQAGFRDDQIGVAAREMNQTDVAGGDESGSKWEEGAVTGALAGAGLGGLVGLGVLAGVIPVIGPVIAGGSLAVLLANAAGGAAVASMVGALMGAGIPEEEAQYYESEFQSGRTIVTVDAGARGADATQILRASGAYDMSTRGSASPAASATSHAATGHASHGAGETIKVHEEHLTAHKQPVETGEVRVRKEVVTENRTLEVPVRREEVVIERHPVAGHAASSADIAAEGEEIRIPVREEQVTVEKHAVVTEEVNIGKRVVTENEQVSGTVRKEQVRVEQAGDVEVRGDADTTR